MGYGGAQQYVEWNNNSNASTITQFYQDPAIQVRISQLCRFLGLRAYLAACGAAVLPAVICCICWLDAAHDSCRVLQTGSCLLVCHHDSCQLPTWQPQHLLHQCYGCDELHEVCRVNMLPCMLQAQYYDYLTAIVLRKNTITGRLYRDDPNVRCSGIADLKCSRAWKYARPVHEHALDVCHISCRRASKLRLLLC